MKSNLDQVGPKEMTKTPNIVRLATFVDQHKDLVTTASMRTWIKKRMNNGADCWIVRLGNRIFVDVDKFFEWTKRKV